MTFAIVLVLAAVQGLTEFLPISSSGHLRLAAAWFGVSDPQTLVDVVLHGGTLVATLWFFRAEVLGILRGLLSLARGQSNDRARLGGLVVLGTIPTGAIGLGLSSWSEVHFSSVTAVGALLIVNGFILWTTKGRGSAQGARALNELTWRDALIIGTVQGLAVLRGISRSGSTIAVALSLGIERSAAAAFSFLLSLPAISAALALLLVEWRSAPPGDAAGVGADVLLVGTVASAVVGLVALRWLVALVDRGHFYRFAPYCWILGGAAIAWSLLTTGT